MPSSIFIGAFDRLPTTITFRQSLGDQMWLLIKGQRRNLVRRPVLLLQIVPSLEIHQVGEEKDGEDYTSESLILGYGFQSGLGHRGRSHVWIVYECYFWKSYPWSKDRRLSIFSLTLLDYITNFGGDLCQSTQLLERQLLGSYMKVSTHKNTIRVNQLQGGCIQTLGLLFVSVLVPPESFVCFLLALAFGNVKCFGSL